MRKFYPNGAAGPAVPPPYIVVTASGAWACDSQQDAIDLRDLLVGSKVAGGAKIMEVAK